MKFLLAVLLGVVGCASSPPERAYYLLRAEVEESLAPATPETSTRLGAVTVAPYLDRAGVVIALEPGRVREASFHLWAEPLGSAVRLYLRDRLAAKLGRELDDGPGTEGGWRYRVDVAIDELHGTLSGDVVLAARWSVSGLPERSVLASGRLARSQAQAREGYGALVATQGRLLDVLAGEIAGALRDLESAGEGT